MQWFTVVRPTHASANINVSLGTNPTRIDLGSVFFGFSLEGKRHFLGYGEIRWKETTMPLGIYMLSLSPPPGSTSLFPGGLGVSGKQGMGCWSGT